MMLNEVQSYADLEIYIRREIARQTAEKIKVVIRLNETWFIKLAKFIQAVLRDTTPFYKIEMALEYSVIINDRKTKIVRI